jgi:SAM-dependent methyltransferase
MTKPSPRSVPDEETLLAALERRVGLRAAVSAKLTLPAVPALTTHYVHLVHEALRALGRSPSELDADDLRSRIAEAISASWRVSAHGSIVLRLDADGSGRGTFGAHITSSPSSLAQQYDHWISTREPPFFGTFPDARAVALLRELRQARPAAAPPLRLLDVGAGTGRNALAFAHPDEGVVVDFIEPVEPFARTVLAGAADGDLPISRLTVDFLASHPPLPRIYDAMLLSEVTSHFRQPRDLARMFARAAEGLLPGGRLLFNVFLAAEGYTPDLFARQIAESAWSSCFTRDEIREALASSPLRLLEEVPVAAYERTHLPDEAWPPRTWYEEWARGQDVFSLPGDVAPLELCWQLYERLG